jgi:hypothetical protein
MGQVLTLFLGIFPSPVEPGHLIGQVLKVCLSHIPCLAHILDLTLQKGNLLNELAGLTAIKGQ